MYEQGKFTPGAYVICDGCKSPFPKSYFTTRGAIQEGEHKFCEDKCRKVFHLNQKAQAEQANLPTQTPITQLELTMRDFRPFVTE